MSVTSRLRKQEWTQCLYMEIVEGHKRRLTIWKDMLYKMTKPYVEQIALCYRDPMQLLMHKINLNRQHTSAHKQKVTWNIQVSAKNQNPKGKDSQNKQRDKSAKHQLAPARQNRKVRSSSSEKS